MGDLALIITIVILGQLLSLVAICVILVHTKNFLTKALVFMKAKDVHDVMAATSLFEDPKDSDESEVVVTVATDEDEDAMLKGIQQKHRKHLEK